MSFSNAQAPSHRSVSNIRPAPSTSAGPASPHTPLRTISSTFGSPSALRAEEDCVVLELGSRYLRAGFAGDAVPKAVIEFGPEEQRRTGDYRRWEANYDIQRGRRNETKEWGCAHELWRQDLRGLDLGLVGDKLDRAVREAFTKYLLIDSRPRRLALVLPSALPLPLLFTVLDTLFTNFQPPTISLMSTPVLSTVAAGLRSALIVDVGWAETVVTAVYEYREISCQRSIRATKMLGEAMYRMLAEAMGLDQLLDESKKSQQDHEMGRLPSFGECEDVVGRIAWCRPARKVGTQKETHGLAPVQEEEEFGSSTRSLNTTREGSSDRAVFLPLSSPNPPMSLRLSFSKLAEPCDKALFAVGICNKKLDDEEQPIHQLVYRSLLQLPVDARAMCMSRITFVGGGANLPGLKSRVLDETATLIEQKGWDSVHGKAVNEFHNNTKLQRTKSRPPGASEVPTLDSKMPSVSTPAAFLDQELDSIGDQLRRESNRNKKAMESGSVRAVKSMGAWSGGSLLQQLKIPAVSVVDKDQWLQHGASGASKSFDPSLVSQRQSMGAGTFRPTAGDRQSWTLGLFG